MTLTVFLQFFAKKVNPDDPNFVPESYVLGILVLCVVIQSILTVGLHCAELQVILLRDESIWRSLSSATGSKRESTYNSIIQPLHSFPNIILLLFKPVTHWFFGSALQVDYAKGLLMRVPQIVYLMILWCLFLLFVCVISFVKPKGTLPATYGHLQTMADIADEVGDVMFFGDKGSTDPRLMADTGEYGLEPAYLQSSELRHAGTSSTPLPPVQMGVLYI
jgi:hypothetical protein